MKYLAEVKKDREGLLLTLKVKKWFGWKEIDSNKIQYPFETVYELDPFIDEELEKWKDFYGDKLTIEDCRRYVYVEDLKDSGGFRLGSEKPGEVVIFAFKTPINVPSSSVYIADNIELEELIPLLNKPTE